VGEQIQKNKMSGAWIAYGREEKCIRTSVGKGDGRRPLGSTRHRWMYNNKIYLQGVERVGAWIGLIWLRIGTSNGFL
jgi:hypothetical protein